MSERGYVQGQLIGFVWCSDADNRPTKAHLSEAVGRVFAAQEPMKKAEIVKLLTRLRVMTKSRAETEEDVILQTSAYVAELEKYPADIVRAVLMRAPQNHVFWPAWKELQDEIVLLAKRRSYLAQMLDTVSREQAA